MKIVERNILSFQEKDLFSPIRCKADYARILALSARILLLENNTAEKRKSRLRLVIDKMNRIFLYQPEKYFSVSFPFTVQLDEDDQVKLYTAFGKELDNKTISAVLAVLHNDQFKRNPSLIDWYIEPGSLDADGLFVLEEIFQFEPGYVRYDFDPERENGKIHPLHHLDINYSNYGTFKLGLTKAITVSDFEDIHDVNSDCSFLKG